MLRVLPTPISDICVVVWEQPHFCHLPCRLGAVHLGRHEFGSEVNPIGVVVSMVGGLLI